MAEERQTHEQPRKTEKPGRNSIEESVQTATVSDQPTSQDTLGFGPYVEAVAEFMVNPDTKPPFTLSIEGEWGSGKTSFMFQLEAKLKERGQRTVQFNAWRHDKEDSLWAAFAVEFLRQIRERAGPRRFVGPLKLALLRFSWKDGWLDTLRFAALFLLFLFATAVFVLTALSPGPFWSKVAETLLPDKGAAKVGPWLPLGGGHRLRRDPAYCVEAARKERRQSSLNQPEAVHRRPGLRESHRLHRKVP